MARPTDLSSLLPTLFGGKALGKRMKESAAWRVWDQAVGPQIATKAQPVAVRDGVLTVAVTSAPWLQQLGFLKRQIIESLNSALGEELVKDIYLKAGTIPPQAPSPSAPPKHPSRALTPEEQQQIRDEAAAISDDELRTALIGLRTAHLKTSVPPVK